MLSRFYFFISSPFIYFIIYFAIYLLIFYSFACFLFALLLQLNWIFIFLFIFSGAAFLGDEVSFHGQTDRKDWIGTYLIFLLYQNNTFIYLHFEVFDFHIFSKFPCSFHIFITLIFVFVFVLVLVLVFVIIFTFFCFFFKVHFLLLFLFFFPLFLPFTSQVLRLVWALSTDRISIIIFLKTC